MNIFLGMLETKANEIVYITNNLFMGGEKVWK